jgi:cytochrome c biogenesis protein CcdA
MNAVGWCGGAMGPVAVGWLAMHGRRASEMENMSAAIAWCGLIYLAGAALIFAAIVLFVKRDMARAKGLPD